MSHQRSFIATTVTGLLFGASVLFIVIAVLFGISAITDQPVIIPGIVSGQVVGENNIPVVYFDPNGRGIMLVILVIAVSYVAASRSR